MLIDSINEPIFLYSVDTAFLNEMLHENRKQLVLFLFIFVVIIVIVLNLVMKLGLSEPLRNIMKQIAKVKSGDYSLSKIVETSDELEEVSKNINMLAQSVFDREERLKESQKQLEYLSNYDDVTGLFNRRSFLLKLDYALLKAQRNKTKVAVLFLDLDNFKQINDTLGHSVGDKLLKLVGERLQQSLRKSDTLARVGGDEYNIFVEGFKNIGCVQSLVHKILDDFKEPFVEGENIIVTSASIGISLYPDDALDTEHLIKNADLAMYEAKNTPRFSYSFYSSTFLDYLEYRVNIINALKHAIENSSEFEIYYQPKVSLVTQKVVGAEALVRWNSPTLGFLSPDNFIHIAEETHLIISIGRLVLEKACRDFVMLQNEGHILEQISINISGIQLEYSDMLQTLKEVIAHTGIETKYLELEVTESYLSTNEAMAIETLNKLRKMGIELAIDDFGTGYSSMSYLKKLPITRLKIDKAFVDDIPESEDSVAIVNAIISLAEVFKMKVTVEGVENQEQVDFFRDKNCDDIQGYVYSKPLALEEFKAFMRKNS